MYFRENDACIPHEYIMHRFLFLHRENNDTLMDIFVPSRSILSYHKVVDNVVWSSLSSSRA